MEEIIFERILLNINIGLALGILMSILSVLFKGRRVK